MIEIVSTELTARPWEHIRNACLDAPAPGVDRHGYGIAIAGWILVQGEAVKSINVMLDGFSPPDDPWLQAPVSIVRNDVLDAFGLPRGLACGFRLGAVPADLPRDFELAVEAVFEHGEVERFATITGRHSPIDAGFAPGLQPLLVTSLGRTGSTWLVRLLSEHPQIVARRVHPFETPASTYWLHALEVLSQTSDAEGDERRFHFTDRSVTHGSPPALWGEPATAEWMRGPYIEQVSAFARRAIDGFYRAVAGANGQPDARYFVEKFVPVHLRWCARTVYPSHRDVVLLRDPRDTLCSILAFNARRGHPGFDRDLFGSDTEYVGHLGDSFGRLLYLLEREHETVLVVRYEDLILDPRRELKRILAYADLDASDGVIAGVLARAAVDSPELEAHRTSGDLRRSIGRWRRDLPPELQRACSDVFDPMLERLGYKLA